MPKRPRSTAAAETRAALALRVTTAHNDAVKMCADWSKGRCSYGYDCGYLHTGTRPPQARAEEDEGFRALQRQPRAHGGSRPCDTREPEDGRVVGRLRVRVVAGPAPQTHSGGPGRQHPGRPAPSGSSSASSCGKPLRRSSAWPATELARNTGAVPPRHAGRGSARLAAAIELTFGLLGEHCAEPGNRRVGRTGDPGATRAGRGRLKQMQALYLQGERGGDAAGRARAS